MQNTGNEFEAVQGYVYYLGLFWQEFNNLELFLRIYLNKKNGNDGYHVNYCLNMVAGAECEENAITDYKSFSQLCNSFNEFQNETDKIDFSEFINLRDALAHGRVSGDSNGNMAVIKFSRPTEGRVTVEYSSKLTIQRMKEIAEEIGKLGMTISLRGGAKGP